MGMNKKAAADVASIDDSRRDQASQQDLPKEEYNTRGAVVQVTELLLVMIQRKAIKTFWATLVLQAVLKRQIGEQEDGRKEFKEAR